MRKSKKGVRLILLSFISRRNQLLKMNIISKKNKMVALDGFGRMGWNKDYQISLIASQFSKRRSFIVLHSFLSNGWADGFSKQLLLLLRNVLILQHEDCSERTVFIGISQSKYEHDQERTQYEKKNKGWLTKNLSQFLIQERKDAGDK